jgi:hypothetical protein
MVDRACVLRVEPVVRLGDRAGGVGSEAEAAVIFLQFGVAGDDGVAGGGQDCTSTVAWVMAASMACSVACRSPATLAMTSVRSIRKAPQTKVYNG